MNRSFIDAWLKNIYRTQEEEISCTECFDQVSHYVDLEVGGREVSTEMPELKQHLQQCRACREEYEALRDLVQLEESDSAPSIDDLRDSFR